MKKSFMKNLFASTLFAFALMVSGAAGAQAPAAVPAPATPAATAASATTPAAPGTAPAAATPASDPHAPFTQSFMFTPAEISLVERAMQGAVSGAAILNADKTQNIPARRVITVSGVVYRGPNDWAAWINGRKVTPGNLLPEIVEINVSTDKVKLRWFDIGLNDIITIEMHPHQTYDIVTGVLLPG